MCNTISCLFYNNGIITIMLVVELMVADKFKWICKAAIIT